MTGIRIFAISVSILLILKANGQKSVPDDRRTYHITETNEAIKIDGLLNEPVWQSAETSTGFFMSYPVDGQPVEPQVQTEIKMAYDRQFLYIAAICHGADGYVVQTLKRDNPLDKGDAFGVVIDPVNERTNGFVFGINPMGVQTEQLITGQTGRREVLQPGRLPNGINTAWDNKWFSEVKRYNDRWELEIAIPFKSLRFDNSKPTWGINFFRFDAKNNSIHTWQPVPIEFTEINLGYTGNLAWQKPPEKVKSNISVIPYALTGISKDFNNKGTENELQAGIDGKVAITSGLNFDLTVNPNFSQVEIDEQITNLTLFNIQLPEKRLFFLENSDIFEDFGINPMRPFLSRKIGLDESGRPIPILFGARLSGNVNKDFRLGAMNLQTRETDEFGAQNYTSVAFRHKVLSRSLVKGYFHNRQASGAATDDYNRTGGIELLYLSNDGRTQAFGNYSKSFNPDLENKNYFYVAALGYDDKNISIYGNLAGTGENYKTDVGYIRGQNYYDAQNDTVIRIGMAHSMTRAAYTFYAKNNTKIISNEIGIRNMMDYKPDFSLITWNPVLNYYLKFATTAMFTASAEWTSTDLLYPFTFTGKTPLPAQVYRYASASLGYDSDQRSLFNFSSKLLYGGFYNGTRSQVRLGLKYRIQPRANFAVMFEYNDLQFPEPYGNKQFVNITPRIDINFSRDLFWTTFIQYENQGDNFNINSRLQWRFRPMSDIYLVYTDNYSVETGLPKYRAVVLKVNYWLNI